MQSSILTTQYNTLLIIFAVVAMTGIICSKLSELLNIPDIVLFLIACIIIGLLGLKFIDISSY